MNISAKCDDDDDDELPNNNLKKKKNSTHTQHVFEKPDQKSVWQCDNVFLFKAVSVWRQRSSPLSH